MKRIIAGALAVALVSRADPVAVEVKDVAKTPVPEKPKKVEDKSVEQAKPVVEKKKEVAAAEKKVVQANSVEKKQDTESQAKVSAPVATPQVKIPEQKPVVEDPKAQVPSEKHEEKKQKQQQQQEQQPQKLTKQQAEVAEDALNVADQVVKKMSNHISKVEKSLQKEAKEEAKDQGFNLPWLGSSGESNALKDKFASIEDKIAKLEQKVRDKTEKDPKEQDVTASVQNLAAVPSATATTSLQGLFSLFLFGGFVASLTLVMVRRRQQEADDNLYAPMLV